MLGFDGKATMFGGLDNVSINLHKQTLLLLSLFKVRVYNDKINNVDVKSERKNTEYLNLRI